MAHTDQDSNQLTPENLSQILQIAVQLQQLEEPRLRREKEERTRAATLERLKLSLGARPAAKTELPGLSQIGSIFERASQREALAVQDIDPGDVKKLEKARGLARTENLPDAELLQGMAQLLLSKGQPDLARFAQQASEVLNPPTPEERSKRKVRQAVATRKARKAQVGGFSVTGGPRGGFAARGTPEEILAQLIATRSPELKAKFGRFTDTGTRPVRPRRQPTQKKKKAFAPEFPGLAPEAGGGAGPDILGALLQELLRRRQATDLGA